MSWQLYFLGQSIHIQSHISQLVAATLLNVYILQNITDIKYSNAEISSQYVVKNHKNIEADSNKPRYFDFFKIRKIIVIIPYLY